MSLALFAPPTALPEDAKLELGQRILYSHRAVVVRWWWKERESPERGSEWVVREGGNRQYPPHIMGDVAPRDDLLHDGSTDRFYDRALKDLTKTVFVYPDENEAVVTGYVRRGIGKSYKGTSWSGSYYDGPEYEQGFFVPLAYAKLYVVRWHLNGTAYGLVPFWAAQPITSEGQR